MDVVIYVLVIVMDISPVDLGVVERGDGLCGVVRGMNKTNE